MRLIHFRARFRSRTALAAPSPVFCPRVRPCSLNHRRGYVSVTGDTLDEPDETVVVALGGTACRCGDNPNLSSIANNHYALPLRGGGVKRAVGRGLCAAAFT